MEYFIMYKDLAVLSFNKQTKEVNVNRPDLLPYSISNMEKDYGMVTRFCNNRLMMLNREYCKEIFLSCGIENVDDVDICIMARGLSLRDNYWICSSESSVRYKDINLYENKFTNELEVVALTGKYSDKVIKLDDSLFTGELTNKGTRPKCYHRESNGDICLYKHESYNEISNEILSYVIAKVLGIDASIYSSIEYQGVTCSKCKIETNITEELIPCRDVLLHFNSEFNSDGRYYQHFMLRDPINFILMQLFDYITLNVDRNRDNFGIKCVNGKHVGLYKLFDHDSCFKGKSTKAVYFPTAKTFEDTLVLLKANPNYIRVKHNLENALCIYMSERFYNIFINFNTEEQYRYFIERVKEIQI